MSFIAGDTPRPFQPAVAQRDIKAEVIYCVGGVTGEPCGVPFSLGTMVPSGICTGAFSHRVSTITKFPLVAR
jgi:hypothetical protein